MIVLEGGETGASDRLPYLQKGILQKLAQATNGIGVILEHRYYGTSFPTPDLSTENLRFLTTEQALADTAYFAQHVRFKGLEKYGSKLTAPNAAYIAYGGSYAGAFVAFLRKTYPKIYYGAISSSGVTEAIWDYWAYYSPVAEFGRYLSRHSRPYILTETTGDSVGGVGCIENTQKLTNIVDRILQNNTQYTSRLQTLFGLEDIKHIQDFANVLSGGVGGWQTRNWDPAVNDDTFTNYCGNLTANSTLYPTTKNLTSEVTFLMQKAGYGKEVSALMTPFLNYVGYINKTIITPNQGSGQTLDQAYSSYNSTFYAIDDLVYGSWRSWPYQYCTQWGFLQTGSGVPHDQLPLISRTLDIEYESLICREAFGLNGTADVASINDIYGGYDISYDRLAIIDGKEDPWRGATPHAPEYAYNTTSELNPNGGVRKSTTEQPFILIDTPGGAVHHWDENGLFANQTANGLPPANITKVQDQEVAFVKAWMKEWSKPTAFAVSR